MALSGTLNSGTFGPSGHYKLQMSWTATQSISGNTSTVTVQMKMWSDSGWSMYTSSTHSGNISIDPSGSSPLVNHGISDSSISTGGGAWVNIGSSISQTITHNSDGTMSFWLDGDFDFTGVTISGTALGDVGFTSTSFTLDTIPRATTLSSPNPPSWTAGNSITFNLTRNSSSFSETVLLEVYNNSTSAWNTVLSITGATTSAAFGNTTAQNTTIFTALAQHTTTQSRLTITTYSGSGSTGSVIGSAQQYTGTVTAPSASTGVIGNPTGVSLTSGQENSTVYIDQSMTINITTHGSGFTHTLNFKNGNSGSVVHAATGVGTQLIYTFSTSEQNTLYADTQLASSIEMDGQVDVYTYYNGVQVNASTNFDINYRVRNSNPTFPTPTGTGISYKDNATAITALTNSPTTIVQNASDLLVTLTTAGNATAQHYATMSYYVVQCGGVTKQVNYSSTATITFDLGKINLGASDSIYITAYDSRGLSAQISIPVTIVPWVLPAANSQTTRNDGFTDPSTMTLTAGTYSQVLIGATPANDIVSVNYQYTVKGTAYPSTGAGSLTAFPSMTHSGGTFSAPNLAVTLASGSTWTTEVQIVDKIMQALGQSPILIDNNVAMGKPALFIDTSLNSVGVNMLPVNGDTLEVGGLIHIVGNSTGNANIAYLSFYESDGATRKGWVGDGGTSDQDITLFADVGNVKLGTTAGGTGLTLTTANKLTSESNTLDDGATGAATFAGNITVGSTITSSATPAMIKLNQWTTASTGAPQIIGGWQGSNYWGIGTDNSTGDLVLKVGMTNGSAVWQSTNITLSVGGQINGNLYHNTGYMIINTYSSATYGTGQANIYYAPNGITGSTGNSLVFWNQAGATIALAAKAYNTPSDQALKTDIVPDTESALDRVKGSTVYTYKYISDVEQFGENASTYTGLIAQEAPNGALDDSGISINLYGMSSVLWKAVQELDAKVEYLKNKLQTR